MSEFVQQVITGYFKRILKSREQVFVLKNSYRYPGITVTVKIMLKGWTTLLNMLEICQECRE